MTIQELHFDFKLKLDKVDSLAREDFNSAEVDWLLNEAQKVYVKQRYGLTNPKQLGFEAIQKRIDDLSTLHIVAPGQVAIVPTDHTNGLYELNLSLLTHTYLFLTRGTASTTTSTCTVTAKLKQIQTDDLTEAFIDPFNSPTKHELLTTFGRSSTLTTPSIYIHAPTGTTVNNVSLEYIKTPAQMFLGGYTYIDATTPATTQCELPAHTHSEIVDLAVHIAAGIIEHPSYVQLKAQKVFEME